MLRHATQAARVVCLLTGLCVVAVGAPTAFAAQVHISADAVRGVLLTNDRVQPAKQSWRVRVHERRAAAGRDGSRTRGIRR
jgi:hypothetical protein